MSARPSRSTSSHPRPASVLGASVIALAGALGGCAVREPISPVDSQVIEADAHVPPAVMTRGGAPSENEADDKTPRWPFWPTSMRLHPLTRLAEDEAGKIIIECRVEFSDADDQTSKAVGQLTVQTYPDALTPTGAGALETWNQDLRDLALNRRQYDDVTRTYLFRLQSTAALPEGAHLRAFFLSVDGRRFDADIRLRR